MAEGFRETQADRITNADHDDGNRRRRLPRRLRYRRWPSHDDVRIETDQLGCDAREPIRVAVGEPRLDVAPFDPSQRLQNAGGH